MAFEWDADKAEANFRKHGVRFASEALDVFNDAYAITVTDDESDLTEQRFVTLGMGSKGRIIVVAYTYRSEKIRLISARVAKNHEREEYDEQR